MAGNERKGGGPLSVGNGLRLPFTGPKARGRSAVAGGGGGAGGDGSYIDGLVKLFPVEGVTLLPMVPVIAKGSWPWTLGLVVAIVGIIVLLRWSTARTSDGKPDTVAIGVAVISFLLYAATLQTFGLVFKDDPARHTNLMSFVTIIWVAAVPKLPRRGAPAG
jgi:hypothetical protein